MNNIIAEQARERYSFSLEQSAKGFWYVHKIEVNGDDKDNLVNEMKDLATKAIMLLDEINKIKE
jgi:hypothetical protein